MSVYVPTSARNREFANSVKRPEQPTPTERDPLARDNARAVRLWTSVLISLGWDDPSDRLIQQALWEIADGRKRPYRAGTETIAKVVGKGHSWTEAALSAMHVRQAELGLVGIMRRRKGHKDGGTSEWDATPARELMHRLAAMRYNPNESDEQRHAKVQTAVADVRERPTTKALMRSLRAQLGRQAEQRANAIPRPPLSAVEALRRDRDRLYARLYAKHRERCDREGLEEGQADLIWTAEMGGLECPYTEVVQASGLADHNPQKLGVKTPDPSDEPGHSYTQWGGLPADLLGLDRWVAWKAVDRDGGKPAKVPICPATGAPARVDNPATWGSFDRARARAVADGLDGIGIVFAADDGLVGIDLDAVRDAATGRLSEEAERIVAMMAGAYVEASPSGCGVHIIAKGSLPPGRRRRKGFEVYDRSRFFTVTSSPLPGSTGSRFSDDRTADLLAVHRFAFGDEPDPPTSPASNTVGTSMLADDDVIDRAQRARNGPLLRRLMSGDSSGYASPSEATAALLGLLVFWTSDAEQIDRLVRTSGLMRPKWDSPRGRSTWGRQEIERAISTRTATYRGGRAAP